MCQTDSGYFGALIIGAGLFGAAVAGPIMDVTHQYNRILKVCTVAATGAGWLLFASLRENNLNMLVCLSLFGRFDSLAPAQLLQAACPLMLYFLLTGLFGRLTVGCIRYYGLLCHASAAHCHGVHH